MKSLAIIYASKGKSTEEIAHALEFFAKSIHIKVDTVNLYKGKSADYDKAINLITDADLVAFGSPTYGNGQHLPEMEVLYNRLIDVEISGKKAMVFGAYGWGKCESVDFLIKKCHEKGLHVYGKKTLDDLIGLRLHTTEIKDDRIINDYLTSFVSVCAQKIMYDNLVLPEPVNGQIRGVDAYRCRVDASNILNIEFENCRFVRVDFSEQFFSNVHFRNCTFWYSNFDKATLNNISFESCDLTDCSFRGVFFERATLKESDLSESDLFDCDLLDAKIDKVCMNNTTFDSVATKPLMPKHVIEKHERSRNYYAASQIANQLYLNAKFTDNYDLAQLFYFRKMENLRKLYFQQSIFYLIFLKLILLMQKLAKGMKMNRISNFLQSAYRHKTTQEMSVHPFKNTLKHLLLVIIKILTGNTISIIRLLCFLVVTITVSSVLLFLDSYSSCMSNINSMSSLALNSICQSLFYTFGIGQLEPCYIGNITFLICYFDGFLGIVIEAVFAYVLIEKITR